MRSSSSFRGRSANEIVHALLTNPLRPSESWTNQLRRFSNIQLVDVARTNGRGRADVDVGANTSEAMTRSCAVAVRACNGERDQNPFLD
jgi:hypothetical protein